MIDSARSCRELDPTSRITRTIVQSWTIRQLLAKCTTRQVNSSVPRDHSQERSLADEEPEQSHREVQTSLGQRLVLRTSGDDRRKTKIDGTNDQERADRTVASRSADHVRSATGLEDNRSTTTARAVRTISSGCRRFSIIVTNPDEVNGRSGRNRCSEYHCQRKGS